MITLRRFTATALTVLGVLGGGLALSVSSASALSLSRQLTGFEEPKGVAVSPTSGDVYVADAKAKVVDEFGSSGEAKLSTAPKEAFEEPNSVAVDSSGDLYVLDNKTFFDRFAPPGEPLDFTASEEYIEGSKLKGTPEEHIEFLGPDGVAVDDSTNLVEDPSAGDLYVVEGPGKKVDQFKPTGEYAGGIEGFSKPRGIAVAPNGDVYVADVGTDMVDEFGPLGEPIRQLTGATTPEKAFGRFAEVAGLAVDPSGDVFVVDEKNKVIDEFAPGGAGEEELMAQLNGAKPSTPQGKFGKPVGVAVDPAGDVYVTDSENKLVDEFSNLPPQVIVEQAANITLSSANVSGSVNPEGAKVEACEFEYGTAIEHEHAEYHLHEACNEQVIEGESPVTVSAELKGLGLHATYYDRLVVTSDHVTTTISAGPEARAFTTGAIPPVVEGVSVAGVTQFSATLSGAIDPENAATGYHFEYGACGSLAACPSSPYESIVPKPDLYTPINAETDAAVPQEITGLHPGTAYHFRLRAEGPAPGTGPGGTVESAEGTFETPGIPLPVASTGGVAGVSEAAVTLTGAVNPEGWETTYTFQYGTSPAFGQQWPTIPLVLGGLSGSQGVSVFVERLQPSTTYFYRVVATNAQGTVYGQPQSFRTGEYPASIIQETPVLGGLPGATAPKKTTTKPETNAQKLAGALKACKKEAKKQQAKCKAQAEKKYGAKKRKKK